MAVQLPGYPLQDTTIKDAKSEDVPVDFHYLGSQWYFSKQELECYSPSRKDGIDFKTESGLRKMYCSYIQELGMELKAPQVTIATSMMLCHRFYLRQSHAKNEWQTIATACVFLASKMNDTPCWLDDVTVVAYKFMFNWNPVALKRLAKEKDIREKQKKIKELILMGERIVLSTTAYDFNIELPYKPLVAALKELGISNKELTKVAWNFVNDWLRTTLCLQYKPHYIAAGSMFLAAKSQQVKLPTDKGRNWRMQFDVTARQLEEVIQEMLQYLNRKRKRVTPPLPPKVVESIPNSKSTPPNFPEPITKCSSEISQQNVTTSSSSHSCVLNGLNKSGPSSSSECGTASSTVVDGNCEPKPGNSKPGAEVGNSKIDVNKIREAMKRSREGKTVSTKVVKLTDVEIDDSEAWIEMELENGIELDTINVNKRIKV